MFCQKCGFQMDDNSKFCPQCATPVAGNFVAVNQQAVYNYQAEKNAIRQSETEAITNAYNYFLQKQSVFDEYDKVIHFISTCSNKGAVSMIVWGYILLFPALLMCLMFAAALFRTSLEGLVFAFLAALVILTPGVGLIVGGILKKKKGNRKLSEAIQLYCRLSVELYNHYLNYPSCPVGPEYINPKVLYKIMMVLRSGRTDTVKESIVIAVNEAGRVGVGRYLQNMQALTKGMNAQTGVNAVFVTGRFFRK